ncbi:MAG: Protein TolB [Candidatus Hydrogenedentes bacterium ADurb.Bin179]|nr:MAG: Protein TolB [Candidatus Hydrogenedentes bacterium ADurb.Bin179]
MMKLMNKIPCIIVCVCVTASIGASGADVLDRLMTLEGFAQPECVVVDPESGSAYVSNINSREETYWQDTGAGFLSRLKADGSLDTLKWQESTAEFPIHQPKGMCILNGTLYVADNTRVLSFSLPDGKNKAIYPVLDAQRLNDMAAGEGKVYVTDVASGKIVRLDTSGRGNHDVVARIEGVNGITLRDGVMYAVSWTLHEVYAPPTDGSLPPVPFGLAGHFTNLDGIETLPDGRFIVSDFTGNKVAIISADRRTVKTLCTLPTPADIGLDPDGNRLYIPQMNSGTVVLLALHPEGEATPLSSARDLEFEELKRQIQERPNWDNARLAREAHRPEALVLESDRTPVDIVWRRTKALLEHLRSLENSPDLTMEAAILDRLRLSVNETRDEAALHVLFHQICALRRQIAFSNPLLDFDRILFLKRHKSIFEHMCDQYYGITARPGGGVYILENAFSDAPRARDLLAGTVVETGRLQGQHLRGGTSPAQLSYDGEGVLTESGDPGGGAFLSPDLSYDGKQILFCYVECRGDPRHQYRREEQGNYWSEHWDPGRAYHIFKVNADGTGLTQLTDGTCNDIHPCWLPDGRVAFVSERRGGFLRCGRVCPTYTLYQMRADGSFIHPLSYHETHEWLPSVDRNGMIVYTRWDYVDRDSDIAHHLWLTYPDGRDPRGPHGNYPSVRELRPWMEMSIRAIPDSSKYIATAATHHGQHFGSLITIDLRQEDDASTGQIRRITPEAMFPEAESAPGVPHTPRGKGNNGQVYGTPWPLNEDFYLAVYDPGQQRHDLYLVDGFGNRELLYRDPDIACSNPIPLRPRPVPPVIPMQTRYAEPPEEQPDTGTIAVMNVYDSLRPFPEGTRLKELRLIQLFAKSTPHPDDPWIGAGDQSVARGSLGTVPIEEDGSVYFEAPAGVSFYFQALDDQGIAVQTMQSDTYLHPGEHLSCTGCHEPKQQSPALPPRPPMALRKPPARLTPEPDGAYPLQFARLVQPVLDAHCLSCHDTGGDAPCLAGDVFVENGWSQAFSGLKPFAWALHGGNFVGLQRNKTSYSIPGKVGARASKLLGLLESGHHGVELSPEEWRRITLWLDGNSTFYGDYHDTVAQARGERATPRLE